MSYSLKRTRNRWHVFVPQEFKDWWEQHPHYVLMGLAALPAWNTQLYREEYSKRNFKKPYPDTSPIAGEKVSSSKSPRALTGVLALPHSQGAHPY